jgi:hypothetical protein
MTQPINEQVIIFTANYTGHSVSEIHDYTTLASIGIITKPETVNYVSELEESFGIQYEQGDANGIVTVGDATLLIESKLHHVEVA